MITDVFNKLVSYVSFTEAPFPSFIPLRLSGHVTTSALVQDTRKET